MLESYRPNQHYRSVEAIGAETISGLVDSGRSIFISDIDGTALVSGCFDPDQGVVDFYSNISANPKAQLVFWTNVTGKSEEELWRMQELARRTGARFVTFKDAPDESKSPAKIHGIIEYFNQERREAGETLLTTSNVVMIGDQLSADIRAGNFAQNEDQTAGVHTIWVDRRGGLRTDRRGDALLRRPAEWIIWNLIHRRKSKEDLKLSANASAVGSIALSRSIEAPARTHKERTKADPDIPSIIPDYFNKQSLIANIGNGPAVRILQETFDGLPPPRLEPIYIAMRALKNNAIARRIERHAAVHGQREANYLTLSRILVAPVVGALILAKQYEAAAILYAASSATDVVDGYLARIYQRHNKDEIDHHVQALAKNEVNAKKTPRIFETSKPGWGKVWDPKADKVLGCAVGPLGIVHPVLAPLIAVVLGRDIYRDKVQRPRLLKTNRYTSNDLGATILSKASTLVQTVANTLSLSIPNINVMVAAQAAAATAKVVSLFMSRPVWERRRHMRERAAAVQAESMSGH